MAPIVYPPTELDFARASGTASGFSRATKGGRTTSHSAGRPRTSTVTCWPSSTPASVSISASAMPACSVGENVPDVVTPTGVSPASTVSPARNTPRPTIRSPRSSRRGPASFSASSASRPKNASFFQPIAQPQRACSGEMSRESS